MRSTWSRLLLGLGAAATVAGCAGPAEKPYWEVTSRLVPDAERALDPASLVRAETVEVWAPGRAEERGDWRVEPAADPSAAGGQLLLPALRGGAEYVVTRLAWIDPSTVDSLAVELGQLGRGTLAVEWRRRDEEFGPQRRVESHRGQRIGEGRERHRLAVARDPRWSGDAVQIRLAVTANPDVPVRVGEIWAIRETVDEAALERAAQRPWKVELERDVRNAVLALPGRPMIREVEVPEGGVLELGFGVQEGVPGAVRFTVSAVGVEGADRPLLEATGSPGEGWNDARLDLGAFAGNRLRLSLEAEVEGAFDPRWGFPLWTGGELLRPTDELPPVVVLISLDTLRADHLSLYGYGRETSPALDRWARERAVVFERAVAAAPWTLPSHVSMLTGLDAHRHGVNHEGAAGSDLVTVAEVFRDAGFTTVGITGGGFVHPRWGFAQGFDSYRYFHETVGFGEEMATDVDLALELLDRRADRPLFLFLHTYEIHNPYRSRQPHFSRLSELDPRGYHVRVDQPPASAEDGYLARRAFTLLHGGAPIDDAELEFTTLELAVDLYDSGIAYADAQLSRLLEALAAARFSGRAAVVVTSDHGEMFGEHGLVTHLALYDENLLVPLVIAAPDGRGAGRRIEKQVRGVDLAPTLLGLAGLPAPEGIDGVSLVPLLGGDATDGAADVPPEAWSYAAASNYGISLSHGGRLKYIFKNQPWPSTAPQEELYDLRRDPAESQDLVAQRPRSAKGSRTRTRETLARVEHGLRITFASRDGEAFEGALVGSMIAPLRVKTADPGCAGLELAGPGRASFRVAAGERCAIWIEDVATSHLTLELAAPSEDGGGFREALDLSRIDDGWGVERAGGGWRTLTGAVEPGTGIGVSWLGTGGVRAASPAETDPALREQLRALGYLG